MTDLDQIYYICEAARRPVVQQHRPAFEMAFESEGAEPTGPPPGPPPSLAVPDYAAPAAIGADDLKEDTTIGVG